MWSIPRCGVKTIDIQLAIFGLVKRIASG